MRLGIKCTYVRKIALNTTDRIASISTSWLPFDSHTKATKHWATGKLIFQMVGLIQLVFKNMSLPI